MFAELSKRLQDRAKIQVEHCHQHTDTHQRMSPVSARAMSDGPQLQWDAYMRALPAVETVPSAESCNLFSGASDPHHTQPCDTSTLPNGYADQRGYQNRVQTR